MVTELGRTQSRGEGLDREIEQRWWPKPLQWGLGALSVAAAVVWGIGSLPSTDELRVKRATLSFGRAVDEPLVESVSFSGTLVPKQQVFLDLKQGGRVEQVLAQVGDEVEEGQPLVVLSNSALEIETVQAESQALIQLTNLRENRSRIQLEALAREQEILALEYEVDRLERRLRRTEALLSEGLVSQQEHDELEAELAFAKQRSELSQVAFTADRSVREDMAARLSQAAALLERRSSVMTDRLGELVVRAPVHGLVTALGIQPGEVLTAGERLGQVDSTGSGFEIEADVEEFYSNRIKIGQQAEALLNGDRRLPLTVSRVDPEIEEGQFVIRLEFAGEQPLEVRRGQAVGLQLALDNLESVLSIPRGSFQEKTGGRWIFVLEGDNVARRRPIRLGRRGAYRVEVLEGLNEGEQVVLSGYGAFDNVESLRLEDSL